MPLDASKYEIAVTNAGSGFRDSTSAAQSDRSKNFFKLPSVRAPNCVCVA